MTQVAAADRCSALSHSSDEPLAGTAGEVSTGYLLIEDPGPWNHDALSGSSVDGLAEQINMLATDAGVKVLLFRAAGRRGSSQVRRCFAATIGHRRQLVGFTVTDPAELLELDLAAYATDLSGLHSAARAVRDPLLMVCTHAKRDQCCAIFGAPLARALTQRYPDRVFECSHLGGHRFAATALALPSGAVYGRLDADLADLVYQAETQNEVIAPQLRGMSHLPAAAQAVDAALRQQLDLPSIDDVHLVECSPSADDPAVYDVQVRAAGSQWRARVALTHSDPQPQSCAKPAKSAKVYRLLELAALS